MRAVLPSVSVRLKLTLLYGGLFLLAGAGLLAVNYALVRSQLNLPFKTRIEGPESARRQLPDVLRQGPLGVVVRVAPARRAARRQRGHAGGRRGRPERAGHVRRKLETAALNQLLAQSGIALALMAVVSIGLGWLVAGRVLRPLSAITATARRLEGSTLHERIDLQGPQDELKELADTFDADARPPRRRLRRPSAGSSPTPPTSCAPPWPSPAPRSTSPSPTRRPTRPSCGPWPSGCSRPTSAASA